MAYACRPRRRPRGKIHRHGRGVGRIIQRVDIARAAVDCSAEGSAVIKGESIDAGAAGEVLHAGEADVCAERAGT